MGTLVQQGDVGPHETPDISTGGGSSGGPQNFGFNLSTAMSQPPGVYTLANGTYSVNPTGTYNHGAGSFLQANRVVLVAETQGQVFVDMGTQAANQRKMELLSGTTNIDFIGLRFDRGSIYNDGDYLRFWYCDHQNLDLTYMTTTDNQPFNASASNVAHDGSGNPSYLRGVSGPPRMMVQRSGASNNQFYGSDYHHAIATVWYMEGLNNNILVQGCKVYDIDHRCEDPVDPLSHIVPGPSCVPGGISNWQVLDTYMEDTYRLLGAAAGSSNGFYQRRIDHGFANASPMLYQVDLNDGRKLLNIVREDWRVWGAANLNANNDPVLYTPTGTGGALQGRFGIASVSQWPQYMTLTQTATLQSSAILYLTLNTGVLAGVTDKATARSWTQSYANLWRAAHPYNTWPAFLGITP